MGVASMIIGIISLFVGFFPICGTWAIIPAFGAVDLISDRQLSNLEKKLYKFVGN